MYEEYFGLAGPPFKLNPDPKFFFGSRSHNKAMAYLHYGLKQAEGFIVITGAVGAGKTMLIGHLLDQLNASSVNAAQLLTSNIEPDELVNQILSAFRIEPEDKTRTGQLEAFEDYLFDQLNRGRRVLLIVDEAQNLPRRTLEELRMLSNMDYDGTPLFQVFLVGQPEFRTALQEEKLEQLKQRIIASYHLEGLSKEECREYIVHRLGVVGWQDDPAFCEHAFDAIYAETEGRPRRINTLANRLMLFCALEKRHEITAGTVQEVIAEMRDEKLGRRTADEEAPARKAAPAVAEHSVNEEAPRKKATPGRKRKSATTKTSGAPPETPVEIAVTKAHAKMKKGEADAMAEDERQETSERADPAATAPQSGSILDRVRARRERAHDDIGENAPTEATLNDVATAIAAASAGEGANAEVESRTPPRNDDWRKGLARSVNQARDELKDANAGIKKLQQTVATDAKRHDKGREKAIANLTRAETMLSEIREARR